MKKIRRYSLFLGTYKVRDNDKVHYLSKKCIKTMKEKQSFRKVAGYKRMRCTKPARSGCRDLGRLRNESISNVKRS